MTSAIASRESGPGYAAHPNYSIETAVCPKRVRVAFGGEIIADSTAALLLYETKHVPVYYFPRADVRLDLLERSAHSTHCPFKEDAAYWTVRVGERRAENAVWSYETPYAEVAQIKDYMAFYWDKMDHWYEEDEEVFVHARDPRVRIDILESSRPVQVVLASEVVAESTRARFLFETGLPTRYYLPAEDVRMDLLEPTDSATACPYKGRAHYWSARVGGQLFDDVVWSYPDPVPEAAKIKDLMCFYNERVETIRVDGRETPTPRTKWSQD